MTYTGVDISKDYFDVDQSGVAKHFDNTPAGFGAFIAQLPKDSHCVMEATGPYSWRLAYALVDAQIAVSVVNPLQAHRYSQALFNRAKTDKVDARVLTLFGEKFAPQQLQLAPDFIACLKQQRALLAKHIETRTAYMNQLHAFAQMPVKDKVAPKMIRSLLRSIETQIKNLEKNMRDTVIAECAEQYNLLESIPSIGPKAATEMIVVTNKFVGFTYAKQLAAYIGVCPRIFQSGPSDRGKARICKMGMSNTRKILYLCSWSAIKCNAACKALYERMITAGKPKQVALIAVVNKLIRQMFAIIKTKKPYQAAAAY